MSRHTITLTASNGATIRTVIGKKYYVVIPNGSEKAQVITRTNSSIAALRAVNRWQDARVFTWVRGTTNEFSSIASGNLSYIAEQEKRAIKQAKANGYKHEAF